ncbi:MAG: hypothetical protein ABIV50_15300, partial [Opitutus sp.]
MKVFGHRSGFVGFGTIITKGIAAKPEDSSTPKNRFQSSSVEQPFFPHGARPSYTAAILDPSVAPVSKTNP